MKMTFDNENRPLCSECLERGIKSSMNRAGGGFSGRRKCQSYRCPRCRRRWLNTKEDYTSKVERGK